MNRLEEPQSAFLEENAIKSQVCEQRIEQIVTSQRSRTPALRELDSLLQEMILDGGPMPSDYTMLNRMLHHLGDAVRANLVSRDDVVAYARQITNLHLQGTMQAKALERKYGYSGDFEMINDIYQMHTSPAQHLRRWDLYFHAQAAPNAVRNRKSYFHQLLGSHAAESGHAAFHVLNVASGSARDMREWMLDNPEQEVFFDCVDAEIHAIECARKACAPFMHRVKFYHRNVLRFLPTNGYNLVWSSGLFDYLSNRSFAHLLKALIAVTRPGGEVVVGNFSDFNPSRDYMELFGDWVLKHRTREHLWELALRAGAHADAIEVNWEPEGVNLFLHIRC